LKLELQRAITKGVAFLKSQQNAESGAWSDTDTPAFSALAISAILGDPSLDPAKPLPAEAEKGYTYLLSNVKSDGGIYGKGLATYNTSLSIMALLQSGKKEHLPVIAKARRLLINQQQDYDKRVKWTTFLTEVLVMEVRMPTRIFRIRTLLLKPFIIRKSPR
jgi:squalene-hopene/tetraprenyl-beta-curcumene cyclase